MKDFFYPETVAVVGVSSSPTNLARAIVYHLIEFRYTGKIYLVGPKGGSFMDHPIYPTISHISDQIDLAAILTPASTLPEIMEMCGQKDIKRVVIESAGFSELGDDKKGLEQQLVTIAGKYGIRFIGPNCIGVINKENGLATPFMPFRNTFDLGPLSIISQSGGVGGALLNELANENLGFNKFASIGNKLDTDENDLLEFLLNDRGTETVFLYLEGIADGRRLMETAFRSSKPILAHKSNTSEASTRIARSHTGSLSASEEVVNAAFRQCSIHRVTDMNSTLTAIKAHALPPMRGNRLAVISRSGGHAVVAADAAAKYGFVLQPFPGDFLKMVESRLRAGVIRLGNPMDLGDLFDFDLFHEIVSNTLARDDIDGMLVVLNYNGIFFEEDSRSLVGKIKEVCLQGKKPVALCVVTTGEEWRLNRCNHPNFPMFTEPEEAAYALSISRDYCQRIVSSFKEAETFVVDKKQPLAILAEAGSRQAQQLTTAKSFEILETYSVPLAPWGQARNSEEAVKRAAAFGLPVAMKVMGEEFIHKSDVGGVLLNLSNEDEVKAGYHRLAAIIQTTASRPKEEAILVQKMVTEGYEVFVGAKQDPVFGPVILTGLGGVYVEIFGDVARRVAPVSAEEAGRMFGEIRGSQLLKGVRGQPPGDLEALVHIVQRVSQLACDLPQIQELDLNPIMVLPKGRGCLVVDCRMVIS
ncbi:MAG: acetate--CoA ligase family protein [Deltaproteobacteria bacterium]|nr:acetate--CoA ligase family protein [Deltaproteobacteria bacterium]